LSVREELVHLQLELEPLDLHLPLTDFLDLEEARAAATFLQEVTDLAAEEVAEPLVQQLQEELVHREATELEVLLVPQVLVAVQE
jgi:hypothetical protein